MTRLPQICAVQARHAESDKLRHHFVEIYWSEESYVTSSLRRRGISSADLDDLRQDVFLRVFRALPTFEASRPLRPWLCTLLLHAVLDFRKQRLRRQKIHLEMTAHPQSRSSSTPPDEALAQVQDRQVVLCAVAALGPKKRAIFAMVELDGTSVPEAAERLGLPINTAYSRMRTARNEFDTEVRRIRVHKTCQRV